MFFGFAADYLLLSQFVKQNLVVIIAKFLSQIFINLILQSTPYCGIIQSSPLNIQQKSNKNGKDTKAMIKVNVIGGTISDAEKEAYVQRARELYPDRRIEEMDLTIVDDDYVDIEYHYDTTPFQRIRRVTGYLAGTLDRFNNAKKAEVRDRVKHDVTISNFEDVYLDA